MHTPLRFSAQYGLRNQVQSTFAREVTHRWVLGKNSEYGVLPKNVNIREARFFFDHAVDGWQDGKGVLRDIARYLVQNTHLSHQMAEDGIREATQIWTDVLRHRVFPSSQCIGKDTFSISDLGLELHKDPTFMEYYLHRTVLTDDFKRVVFTLYSCLWDAQYLFGLSDYALRFGVLQACETWFTYLAKNISHKFFQEMYFNQNVDLVRRVYNLEVVERECVKHMGSVQFDSSPRTNSDEYTELVFMLKTFCSYIGITVEELEEGVSRARDQWSA